MSEHTEHIMIGVFLIVVSLPLLSSVYSGWRRGVAKGQLEIAIYQRESEPNRYWTIMMSYALLGALAFAVGVRRLIN